MSRRLIAAGNLRFCWTLLLVAFVASCLGLTSKSVCGQQPPAIEFNLLDLPGSRLALNKLANPAIATFEKRPLAECLESLSEFYNVAIWIDRRVDRSRLISLVGLASKEFPDANTTFGRIRAIAKLGDAEAGLIENIVYVGPKEDLAAVQFSAVRLHNEIVKARKAMKSGTRAETKLLRWDELTTPTELLNTIGQQWSVQVDATLPHDLMHAGKLPASTLATQLTLLFAGFGQQVECKSANTFTVSGLTKTTDWKSDYAAKAVQTSQYSAAKKDHPHAMMQMRGGVCTIIGPTAFHLRLLTVRTAPVRNLEPKFTLSEVRGPIEQIVGGLAKHLSLEVSWSEAIPLSKKQAVISFGVLKAKTPDEILAQLAKECELSIQRDGETIVVSPQ